ncbi:MAG: PHP domain-containing protein, partial [Candidatus Helarchaeota archaeon]
MLFDLHVHSKDSSCSKLTMKQIIMSAKLKDLDAVCIVNHDKISEIHLKSRILILIGCEVTTKDGHLL